MSLDLVPQDLWAAEILPLLSFHQLTKVTRVSKKFYNISKITAPNTIDIASSQTWLDRARLLPYLPRCKFLSLSKDDAKIIEYLATLKELQFESLDLHTIAAEEFPVKLLAAILKNNKPNCLQVLKLPLMDFKALLAEDVMCPSVRSLVITNGVEYSFDDDSLPPHEVDTGAILKVFPSLKRLDLANEMLNDVSEYLMKHSDVTLEHVGLSVNSAKLFDGEFIAPLKSLSFSEEPKPRHKDSLKNLSQLTHLKVHFGYCREQFVLPKMENLLSLKLEHYSDANQYYIDVFDKSTKLTKLDVPFHILDKMKLPKTLKCVKTPPQYGDDYEIERLLELPNLECLRTACSERFWNLDKTSWAHTMKRLILAGESSEFSDWSPTMNVFVNLTQITLRFLEISSISPEFFKTSTKLTHFRLDECPNITSIPLELRELQHLQVFIIWTCGLKSIPEGLKDLEELQEVDLRENPFDQGCEVPLTLPIRTVAFKDPEWIRTLQTYLKDNTKVPTVNQMLTLPFLKTKIKFEEGRMARLTLVAFKVPGVELEENDENSEFLASAIMRSRRRRVLGIIPIKTYLDKDITVGAALFNEYSARSGNKMKLVKMEVENGKVRTYALQITIDNKNSGGWSSRAVWRLDGYLHEFDGASITEKKKLIRTIVEPK